MNQYQVSFGEAIRRAFSKYCCFTGRASRSEYWWFTLLTTVVSYLIMGYYFVYSFSETYFYTEVLSPLALTSLIAGYVFGFAILLPSLGLQFRRLHDTGRSGWNILWGLIPLVGAIILIVFYCQPSVPEENKYGPVPNLR